MERGHFQGIAAALERIVENTRFDLREAIDQFQELCLMITAERNVPTESLPIFAKPIKEFRTNSQRSAEPSNSSKENTGSIIAGTISAKERSWKLHSWPRVCLRTSNITLQEIEAKKKLKR